MASFASWNLIPITFNLLLTFVYNIQRGKKMNSSLTYEQSLHDLFPGRYARPTMNVGPVLPPKAVYGEGAYLVDENEHRVLDLNNNFTSNIHGHGHQALLEVSQRILRQGVSFGIPTVHELHHANELVRRIEGAEMVKYAVSGTEAVMTAIRMARAWSGRSHVIVIRGAYHGSSDLMVANQGERGLRGVPKSYLKHLTGVELNDIEGLRIAVENSSNDLAAIVLDLMPNYTGLIPLSDEFIALARKATHELGACLIIDEVVSFRHATGGLQAKYNVIPDMTVLGKLIGGGFSIGAIVGKKDVMSILDPTVVDGVIHGGTFAANPLAMGAGLKALELYDAKAVERLHKLGDFFRECLQRAFPQQGRWHIRGFGSLLRLEPHLEEGDATLARRNLWWAAYKRGVLMTPGGLMSLSTPMTEQDLRTAADGIGAALSELQ